MTATFIGQVASDTAGGLATATTPNFSALSWAAGDVAVCFVNIWDDPGTITAPATGWVQVWQSSDTSGTDGRAAVFVKTLAGGEDTTPTFDFAGSFVGAACLSVWRNVAAPGSWTITTNYNFAGSGGAATLAPGPVTVPTDAVVVTASGGRAAGGTVWTPPSGYTAGGAEITIETGASMAYRLPPAGTETAGVWTRSASGRIWATSVVLEAAIVATPPDAPSDPDATVESSTEIRVSWDDVDDETGYRVERSADGSTGWTNVSGDLPTDTTSFLDEGLTPETTYYYRVYAFSDEGDSDPSDVVSATIGVAVPPPAQPLRTFGGQIDVRVEVDTGGGEGLAGLWDSALWDTDHWGSDDAIWVDFTPYVLSVSTFQGAERWGERIETGTASVTVDNTTGIFTPEIGVTDPWYRPFRPGRRIRIVAIPDPDTGDRVPLFTGRLDAAYGSAADAGHAITSVLQVVDFMGDWNAYDPLAMTATGAQRTDLRVHAALNRYDWPADERDIQTGVHNVQTSTLAETTLEECQQAADAEGGLFYCSKNGYATFKNRDWLTTDARSVNIQGYIGYDEVPAGEQAAHIIADPETSWELARVTNHAAYARVGGVAQETQDLGSWAAYGVRSHKRTDLLNTTDAEVLTLAVRMVNARKDLRPRADEIAIGAVEDPDNEDLNRLLWDTELGDRVSIQATTPYGWTIEREAHVFGITHEITADDWVVVFRLDDAQVLDLTYWQLEDPLYGVLGETTRVA